LGIIHKQGIFINRFVSPSLMEVLLVTHSFLMRGICALWGLGH
jgi:hypothetical protein